MHYGLIIIPASVLTIETLYTQRIRKFFSKKAFVVLNKISLAVYILHWPVFCSLGIGCMMKMGLQVAYTMHAFLTILLSTILVCLISIIFHVTVEKGISSFIKKITL